MLLSFRSTASRLLVVPLVFSSRGGGGTTMMTTAALHSSTSNQDQHTNATTTSALERARQLVPPSVVSSTAGETEHADWWEQHASLLREAWTEWEETAKEVRPPPALLLDNNSTTATVASGLIHEALQTAVENAWEGPSLEHENALKSLWTEVAPAIYTCPFLTPEGIRRVRAHLDPASQSQIPTRRPNGMNRYGMILHPPDSVDGAVNLQAFEAFYQELVDTYIRPTMRALFPEYAGDPKDDSDSYSFTIKYSANTDMELKEHSDASLYTMNVNLNLPHETYSGSDLNFSLQDGSSTTVTLQPGVAVLHLGQTRHSAQPIASGSRMNWIIWVHGEYGYVRIVPYAPQEQMSVQQRWSSRRRLPVTASGSSAKQASLWERVTNPIAGLLPGRSSNKKSEL